MPSLVEIGLVVLEKKILKIGQILTKLDEVLQIFKDDSILKKEIMFFLI